MIRLALHFLLAIFGSSSVSGRATVYWPGDGMCGTHRADGRRFRSTDGHIAHRWIPLGTPGLLCSTRTGRCVLTYVGDRGPFGQIRPCSETTKGRKIRWRRRCYRWRGLTRLVRGWEWRGAFDLTRRVARSIGHRPFDQVVFFYARLRR